ncbi:uncharacterized protein TNCV_4351061 [Trichonephila clavipes]|nr:uncharacterized protein TNCV_4351061 [Trichonephila clavipes]
MSEACIFQQDGESYHYHNDVASNFKAEVPNWIGRRGVILWPSRSPYLSQVYFSVWGFVKHRAYISPFSASIPELKSRIYAATNLIDGNLLTNLWQELIYRWDICIVTKGIHIEHL